MGNGNAGEKGNGSVSYRAVRQARRRKAAIGVVRQARSDADRCGLVCSGMERQVRQCVARSVLLRRGTAGKEWRDEAGYGMVGQVRLGEMRIGLEWRGRQVVARIGKIRTGRLGQTRRDKERCAQDWQAWNGSLSTGPERQAFFNQRRIEMALEVERKVLTKLARQHGGVLMVDHVLEEAKSESSPLHSHFEWNDSVAAEAHRRNQARTLIQRCKITLIETEPVQIRAFVSLPTDRDNGGGYRLTSTVMSDEMLKQELLRDIKMTIQRWTKKMHLLDQDLAEALIEVEERVTLATTNEARVA